MHYTFRNCKECYRKNAVICFWSLCVIWCVFLIPAVYILFDWVLLNEIKIKFLKYHSILSIFKWIIWELEIVENQSFGGILLKYWTCSRKKMHSWRHTFYCMNTDLSHSKKIYIKVSVNSVQNFSDAHSPIRVFLR